LVVELDGGQHAEQAIYDETRSAAMRQEGFRTVASGTTKC
jgi:very-short-patch-repair endonuclease